MNLFEIEAFDRIADTGSFTGAAHALGISQPAVSRRIDLLERELGTALVQRLPSGARLTDAGEALLPFARRILADVRDATLAVREHAAGRQGSITLAVVGTLASTTLLHRLRAFRTAHPDVRLLLRTANSHGVSELVRSGEAQLGLRYFDDPSSDLETTLIAAELLVVVCSADSTLATAEAATSADLARVPWVGFPAGSSGEPFARVTDRFLDDLGAGDAERIEIDSLTAQKRVIEADFGVGVLQQSAITEEVRLGTLRVIEDVPVPEPVPVMLVRRREGYRNAASETLIAALAGQG